MNDKSIFIVLSQTGAFTSKALKFFTLAKYNHVSISLTPTLEKMYSFGRLRPYNPFRGGFVEEGKNIGTFARFKNTNAQVLELKVNDEEYEGIKAIIESMLKMQTKLHYNYFGAFLAYFRKNYAPKNKFYCSQFVRFLLDKFNISNISSIPLAAKPMDFLKLADKRIVYTGLLKNYNFT